MMTKTTIAGNGRRLISHDHSTEWSVCGRCGTMIDWTSEIVSANRDEDDLSCPYCGHEDTGWLYAD